MPVGVLECTACDGRGRDDSGPGSWYCWVCKGTGLRVRGWPHEQHTARLDRDHQPYAEIRSYDPQTGRYHVRRESRP
jgi:phage/plasmid primase-like uncharacterized protein